MKKRRVLVIYSCGGGGLKHLAENIKSGLRMHFGGKVDAEVADPFRETNGIGNLLFSRIYNFFLYHNLSINAFLVETSYLLRPDKNPLVKWEVHSSLGKRLRKYDLIISTSPWVLEGLFHTLKKENLNIPVMVYVADFGEGMYRGWFHRKALAYLTATSEAKTKLIELGAKPESIEILGIPDPRRQYKAKKTHASLKSIMIASSIRGSSEIESILDALDTLPIPFTVNVMCGTSTALRRKLALRRKPFSKHKVNIYGFVAEKHFSKLMAESDLIITKAGALTIAKAISTSTPMLIIGYPAIMLQEKGNAKFVSRRNIGYLCRNRNEILKKLAVLSASPRIRANMEKNINKMRGFTNSKRICGAVLQKAGIIS